MAQTDDYYKLLGVDRSASADEIRKAYRKLARKYHPDVNKEADAATRFAEVQEAYDTLSDAEKRKMYDQFGSAGPSSGGFHGDPRWAHATSSGGYGQTVDFSEIVNHKKNARLLLSGQNDEHSSHCCCNTRRIRTKSNLCELFELEFIINAMDCCIC